MNLGLIGDEYKNCRTHLLKHLTGDIAWRHPEDGVAQRERLRQERIAAREQEQRNEPPCDERVEPVSEVREEVGETPDENLETAVSDCARALITSILLSSQLFKMPMRTTRTMR